MTSFRRNPAFFGDDGDDSENPLFAALPEPDVDATLRRLQGEEDEGRQSQSHQAAKSCRSKRLCGALACMLSPSGPNTSSSRDRKTSDSVMTRPSISAAGSMPEGTMRLYHSSLEP